MKNNYKIIIPLIIVATFIVAGISVFNKSSDVSNLTANFIEKVSKVAEAKEQTPIFLSGSVEPFKVAPGDEVIVTVEIKDNYGIKEVKADMGGIASIMLELIEGNVKESIWQGKWIAHDTEPRNYQTIVYATNILGKQSSMSIGWEDPTITDSFTDETKIASKVNLTVDTTAGRVKLGFELGWLDGWDKRVKLTIDNTDITSALSNFPVLIYLSTSSGRNNDDVSFVFDELQSNANRKKIAVTASDGTTERYVEIEKWDDANEKAWLWVKVPSIASGADTDLYLYYDIDHADNTDFVGDPNSTPAENVWDSNFKLVTHMRDDPNTSNVRDSTSNNNDGAKKGAGEPAVTTAGKIDGAQDFDGNNDYIRILNDASLDFGTDSFTISGLVKTPTSVNSIFIANRESSAGFEIRIENTLNSGSFFMFDGATAYSLVSSVAFNDNISHLFTLVVDGRTSVKIYKDGVEDESATPTGVLGDVGSITNANPTYIGAQELRARWYLNGIIDEVRISKTARTPAWIKASYESGRDDLLDFGSEEGARFRTAGTLTSTNLLFGETVSSIDSFGYNASSIPAGTGLKVQFSQDNSNWYDSSGNLSQLDTMSQGSNSIDLSGLGWSGPNFYYKMEFTSDGTDTPILDEVSVDFSSWQPRPAGIQTGSGGGLFLF